MTAIEVPADRPAPAPMSVIVQKYGGSSLSTLERIRHVARLVEESHRSGRPTVVVVSARGDGTDQLLETARAVGPAQNLRELDQLLATGEVQSAALLALALHCLGVPAVSLTGAQAGIRVAGKYGAGIVAAVDTERIRRALRSDMVVVVAGFQGIDEAGDVVTLGRGGSDTTAVALAVALGAVGCHIYSDVEGVFSADPRVVPDALLLPAVEPAVMAEMAFAGARVLHSRAVELAALNRMDLFVRSTFSRRPGSVILGRSSRNMLEASGHSVAVTHDLDVAHLSVQAPELRPELAAELLAVLADRAVPVDMVSWALLDGGTVRLGFAVRRSQLREALWGLRKVVIRVGCRIWTDDRVGKVSLVGMGLLNRPEYSARMLATLGDIGVAPVHVCTTQLRTSVLVPEERVLEAVARLHRAFEPDRSEDTAPDGSHQLTA